MTMLRKYAIERQSHQSKERKKQYFFRRKALEREYKMKPLQGNLSDKIVSHAFIS